MVSEIHVGIASMTLPLRGIPLFAPSVAVSRSLSG